MRPLGCVVGSDMAAMLFLSMSSLSNKPVVTLSMSAASVSLSSRNVQAIQDVYSSERAHVQEKWQQMSTCKPPHFVQSFAEFGSSNQIFESDYHSDKNFIHIIEPWQTTTLTLRVQATISKQMFS